MAWEYAVDHSEKKDRTPLQAIRAKCIDCSGGSSHEVKMCPIDWCPLYGFRDGHNPKRKGVSGSNNARHRSITENLTTELTEGQKGGVIDG